MMLQDSVLYIVYTMYGLTQFIELTMSHSAHMCCVSAVKSTVVDDDVYYNIS